MKQHAVSSRPAAESHAFDVASARAQFPALTKGSEPRGAEVFFDGPGGTQVPVRVVTEMTRYLLDCNANTHGAFRTSEQSDHTVDEARLVLSAFFGAADPREVVFGANMTTLTFALSRALARRWGPGDEVVVTRLDHDANITPWVLAARDAGATVRWVEARLDDCTLDLESLDRVLSERTRLVAVGYASNAVGTIHPVREIARRAHAAGALCFVDAVQYAPHGRIDVSELGCDFLAASAYKFFGPHLGVLWGRYDVLAELEPYRVRPASERPPGAWETGTQNHEGIAGAAEAVRYLADLGGLAATVPLRARLEAAWTRLEAYERTLCAHLLDILTAMPSVRVYGITERSRLEERVPTVAFTVLGTTPREVARKLGERGFFVWDGSYYAVEIIDALKLAASGGAVRVGLVHYNTREEIERFASVLETIAR